MSTNTYRKALESACEPREERQWTDRRKRTTRPSTGRRRNDLDRAEKHPANESQSARTLGSPPKPEQRATARPMAGLHPRMVELLQAGRKAVGSGRPERMDPPPHAKVLLATLEHTQRAAQRPTPPRRRTKGVRSGLQRVGSMADSPATANESGPIQQATSTIRVHLAMDLRGGST